MDTAAAVVSIVFALMCLGSAAGKVVRAAPVQDNLSAAGVPDSWYPGLAALLALGGAGLLVGLAVEGVGIAAAIALVAYFVGGVAFHVRAGDRNFGPVGLYLALSIATLVLLLLA